MVGIHQVKLWNQEKKTHVERMCRCSPTTEFAGEAKSNKRELVEKVKGGNRVVLELNLQTVQRCADNPGGLWLAGQLKGQHILVSLNVSGGSGLDHVGLPARYKRERKKYKHVSNNRLVGFSWGFWSSQKWTQGMQKEKRLTFVGHAPFWSHLRQKTREIIISSSLNTRVLKKFPTSIVWFDYIYLIAYICHFLFCISNIFTVRCCILVLQREFSRSKGKKKWT